MAALALVQPVSAAPTGAAASPYVVDFTDVGDHTWQVPPGVTAIDVTMTGGQGGLLLGGLGARVVAHVPVSPGATLDVSVAGAGSQPAGGFGGGADGGTNSMNPLLDGGGGGGASSIALHANGSPLVVAGGGGGAAPPVVAGGASGTIGGGTTAGGAGGPGGPGTASGPGAGGVAGPASQVPACVGGVDGRAGAEGLQSGGGIGASSAGLLTSGAGGGGGGYTGGGGGGTGGSCLAGTVGLNSGGGGGGSSFVIASAAGPTITQGARSGNGQVEISYVDDAAPTAAPQVTPTPNASGWIRATTAEVTWNWTDALSGIDPSSCTTSSTDDTQGVSVEQASCTDRAGNVGQASLSVRLDTSRPTIVLRKPLARTYHRHARVTASFACADSVSGIAACHGTVANHHRVSTRSVGKHSFAVTAHDKAGNTTTKKVRYRVVR